MPARKLVYIFIFILSTSLSSQAQTSLGFSAGINIPTANAYFRDNYNVSFNAGMHHEWVLAKPTSMGWEFTFASYTPKYEKLDPVQTGGFLAYLKLQDNTMRADEFQIFVKGGAGLGFAADGKPGGHPSFPPFAIALVSGAGANYILPDRHKIFLETDYRQYIGGKQGYYHGVFLNAGFSFDLQKLNESNKPAY